MEHDAAASGDLADGMMRAVEIDGRACLLVRVNGVCHAVENTCPHAGAKLDTGVLDGSVVICPWHKAAFCVTTGRRKEPPAVDDLARFPVREAAGRILVTIEAPALAEAAPASAENGAECGPDAVMAIVGEGAAGAVAAQTLREEGFGGRVVLIGREASLPYDRTVLSKYALSGKQGAEKTPLQSAEFYARNDIERVCGEVVSVDPASHGIRFSDRPPLAYDSALIATGGTPRRPQMEGASLAGVFVLRSMADAQAIAAAATGAASAVVAGSGFIAMEAAASLRERGLAVTVVAPQEVPFERQLGREVGLIFRKMHERHGIVFRLGDEVAAIEGDGRAEHVRLQGGDVLPADLVVFGLGVEPATRILPDVALLDDGGIPADSRLCVAEGVYAAGDVAAFPYRGSGERIRVEHWRVAQQHGRVAALNMMGGDVAYDAVPYFWTIHFMKRLDYVGHAATWDRVIIDGCIDAPQFIAYYEKGGAITALAGFDRDRQMAAAIVLMTRRQGWRLSELRGAIEAWA